MKKFLLAVLIAVACMSISAQESLITLRTTHELGDDLTLFPTPVGTNKKISVDWGDGEIKEYTLSMFVKSISGTKVGEEIKIMTPLSKFDCSDSKVSMLIIENQPDMVRLDCYNNEIQREIGIAGAPNLEVIDCHNNPGLLFLNLTKHSKLTTLDCYSYSEGTITTVFLPTDGAKLESVTAYGNDISALDVSTCPNLSYLNMEKNSLMDIDVSTLENLRTLNVSENLISTLDVTKNLKLEELSCSGNFLKSLDVYQNTELLKLFCGDNELTKLNLTNNKGITHLTFTNNKISIINLNNNPRLLQLRCAGNGLNSLELSENTYLQKLWASENNFQFLDFFFNSNLNYIDIRNNTKMNPSSLNYMYSSLSGLEESKAISNLLVEGSNAETSDTSIATESRWTPDVTGDGTAPTGNVTITHNTPENGTYTIAQPRLTDHELIELENGQAAIGVPTYVIATPDEGYLIRSITVNDKPIEGNIFIVSEDTKVDVQFAIDETKNVMTMSVENNKSLSLTISGTMPETEVKIDWGNGEIEAMVIDNVKLFPLDNTTKGNYVSITGAIDYLDCSSNPINGLDVTKNPSLATLDCYDIGLTTLDLTKNPELKKLSCSYNDINTLDITSNTKLFSLSAYGCNLNSIDLTKCELLEEVNIKNNNYTSLDFSKNTLIENLDIQGNKLESIDLSALTNLQVLAISNNLLPNLDLSKNVNLIKVLCAYNKLTILDLSGCVNLETLYCNDNNLITLDFTANKALKFLDLGSNNMSACTLNDIYYTLPVCPTPERINLFNYGSDVTANDADHSETTIATKKGWIVSGEGDSTGCPDAYVTIEPSQNGSIKLFVNGTEVKSASKITKGSEVTVEATPSEGYYAKSIKANGVAVVNKTFTISKATTITAIFEAGNSVDNINSDNIRVTAIDGAINISAAQAIANIYSTNGVLIKSINVEGQATISIASGLYIVNVANAQSVATAKIAVE